MSAAQSPLTSSYARSWSLGRLDALHLLALHQHHPERYPVLLESAAPSLQGHNYDILMAFPGERLQLHAIQGLSSTAGNVHHPGFLSALDNWWRLQCAPQHPYQLPFSGGWFIYLGYELAAEIEPSLTQLHTEGLIAQAVRMPAAIVRSSDTCEAWFVAEMEFRDTLDLVQTDLSLAVANMTPAPGSRIDLHEENADTFVHAVQHALAHIAAGDVYQANLSRGWTATLDGTPAAQLYQALRAANPAPFAGLARLAADHTIISSSPERLIELRNGWANTRPIAGTRPRHRDAAADRALLEELHAHPKERAEHIMLLDLERNDLGRICVGGTVEVNEYMSIESYAHVHHIVSNVRGRLRPEVTPGEAIAAVFPGGTITGCPKVRCMEIIADLEHTARGAYTGSMGYLNRDGSMDLNILIRTLELQGNQLRFRAGAGIVADSVPERELEETRAKALGLRRALQTFVELSTDRVG